MNKTMRWSLLCWGVACGTTCGTMLSAQAQPEAVPNLEDIPENYRAPLPAQVEKAAGKKSVDADALAPVTGGGQNRAGDLPATVQSKAAVAASVKGVQAGQGLEEGGAARIVLPRLLSGEMTLEAALKSSVLNVGDIEWVLSKGLWPWGSFGSNGNIPLRREMAKAWVEANEKVLDDKAKLLKLPRSLRLWVADYLQRVSDERAVAICEQIVKEIPTPVDGDSSRGDNPMLFQALERIAWYYRRKGDHLAASKTWQRIPPLFAVEGWWTTGALHEAVRNAVWSGQAEAISGVTPLGAALAKRAGDEHSEVGVLILSQALIKSKQNALAMRWLQEQLERASNPGMKVVLGSMLGKCLLETGDIAGASKYLQKVTDVDEVAIEQSPWARSQLHDVREQLSLLHLLQNSPVLSDPSELQASLPQDALVWRSTLRLRSLKPLPLMAQSPDPSVKLRLWRQPQKEADGVGYGQEVKVEIDLTGAKPVSSSIVVQSAQLPKWKLEIPLRVDFEDEDGDEE